MRVPGRQPTSPCDLPGVASPAEACAALRPAGVWARGWRGCARGKTPPPHCGHGRAFTHTGRSNVTTLSRCPRSRHPRQASHAPGTDSSRGWQQGHERLASRLAGPTSRCRRSASRRHLQCWSCAPGSPTVFPWLACTTSCTRRASAAMRPTGSRSLRSSRLLCAPHLATAKYVPVSHSCPRRPTNV